MNVNNFVEIKNKFSFATLNLNIAFVAKSAIYTLWINYRRKSQKSLNHLLGTCHLHLMKLILGSVISVVTWGFSQLPFADKI